MDNERARLLSSVLLQHFWIFELMLFEENPFQTVRGVTINYDISAVVNEPLLVWIQNRQKKKQDSSEDECKHKNAFK